MSKINLREQAIKLRIEGYSYSQIKKTIDVSKGTLNKWLSGFPLTVEQQKLLSSTNKLSRELAKEKFRSTMLDKKLKRLEEILKNQDKLLLPLSEKELFLAGLFLYWGEGEKTHGRLSLSNTDPKIVKFAYHWMINSLKIPQGQVKVQLHLYKDMNFEKEINFWSEKLGISREQFYKPYIKKTNREGLTYKSFGHGTCKLYYGNVPLSERVAMSIKAISNFYGEKSESFWYN
jgi:hypothetical protein